MAVFNYLLLPTLMLNKQLHLHVKTKNKHHIVNPVKKFRLPHDNGAILRSFHGASIGLMFLVVSASILTWILCEVIVFKLQEIDDNYNVAVLNFVKTARPAAKAQATNNLLWWCDFEDVTIDMENRIVTGCENALFFTGRPASFPPNKQSISTDYARTGSRSAKFVLRGEQDAGDCQANYNPCAHVEFAVSSNILSVDLGEEIWLGYSVYLPADFRFPSNSFTLTQFHNATNCPYGSGVPVLNPAENNTFHNWVSTGATCESRVEDRDDTDVTSHYRIGQWNDVVIHAKFNYQGTASDHYYQMWINQEYSETPAVNSIIANSWPSDLFWAFGLYGRPDYTTTVYYDSIKYGGANSTFADVAPGDSTAPPPVTNCTSGETRPCQTDRPGVCAEGTEACSNGDWSGICSPDTPPSTEICGNGIDEDCSGSDLACPGVRCEEFNQNSTLPVGWGSPYDFFGGQGLLIEATCDGEQYVNFNIGGQSPDQYVWHRGYVWRNNQWQPVTLSGRTSSYGVTWLYQNATARVSLSAAEQAQDNYFVAYICTRTSSGWRCGCRDAACAGQNWQLQRFSR